MSDNQKQAHDFAISVLNDYLSKNNLTNNLTEISKLTSNDSDLFNIYYFSYYGFLHSLKCHQKKNLKEHLNLLAEKLRLK